MKKRLEEKYQLNEATSDAFKISLKAATQYHKTRKKAEDVLISNLYAALNKAETEADFDQIDAVAGDVSDNALNPQKFDDFSDAIHKKWREVLG